MADKIQTAEEYRSQFGVVKASDLPRRERRARPQRKAKRTGSKLGPMLKQALRGL